MLIVFDLESKEITGIAMIHKDTSGLVPEPTLENTYPDPRIRKKYGGLTLPNNKEIANDIINYQIVFDNMGNPKGIERRPIPPTIEIMCNAPDHDGNGIPEITADGMAQTTITAVIKDANGKIMVDATQVIIFKTTAGKLLQRNVKPVNGQASVTLVSSQETVSANITASSKGCKSGQLEIEFLHPDVAVL